MGVVEFLTALMAAIIGVSKAVEIRTKPTEIRQGEFEIKKEKLTVMQRKYLLHGAERDLRKIKHRKLSIDAYCEVAFDSLDEDDKQDLKNALYEIFPKRKNKVTN